MKIYAIIDDDEKKELAYFIYYEKINECYIEIRDDVDVWDLPFILEHFVRNGKRTVDPYHTLLWLRQRVVPSDRQNIGMICTLSNSGWTMRTRLMLYKKDKKPAAAAGNRYKNEPSTGICHRIWADGLSDYVC